MRYLLAIPLAVFLASGVASGADDDPNAPPPKTRHVQAPLRTEEIEIRGGESMGLYGRWARIEMRSLYARTSLRWNQRLSVGRKLTLRLTDDERTRFVAARDAYHKERDGAHLAGGSRDHTVRAGDNPWRIARRLAVPVWTIERLNAGRNWRRLRIGDIIKVPATHRGPSARPLF